MMTNRTLKTQRDKDIYNDGYSNAIEDLTWKKYFKGVAAITIVRSAHFLENIPAIRILSPPP